MTDIKELRRKQIWQLQLQAIEQGKDCIKAKRPRIVTGEAYIKGKKGPHISADLKSMGKTKPKVSNKSHKALSKLRDGDIPATQKQIDYIEVLLAKSQKTYDYYYPRDKYRLSSGKAGAFIQAIGKQEDFSFNCHTKAYKKFIRAKINNSQLDYESDMQAFFDQD
jgi:hypothetical protein